MFTLNNSNIQVVKVLTNRSKKKILQHAIRDCSNKRRKYTRTVNVNCTRSHTAFIDSNDEKLLKGGKNTKRTYLT